MQNKSNSRRINGTALEMIMRDVLDGMFDFTNQTCCGCETTKMEILSVEKPGNSTPSGQPENVIQFPGKPAGK